jgi:hypothetical protein
MQLAPKPFRVGVEPGALLLQLVLRLLQCFIGAPFGVGQLPSCRFGLMLDLAEVIR